MAFKKLSLRIKMFVLLITAVLFASAPLILIFDSTARTLSKLGQDPKIEKTLEKSIEELSGTDRDLAVDALKSYRTMAVLKPGAIVRQSLIASIILSVFILLIYLMLGFVFITRITRPIRDLTKATRDLARGQEDSQVLLRAGGEMGILIDSFNDMAHDLKMARQQLALAERRATWQRVARTIAHEIKNPLTPIKLSTERLYDKFINNAPDFPEVIQSASQTILSEIDNLQRLVETFHKYAKFPDPVLRAGSFNDILREVAALFQSQGAKIETRLDPSLPSMPLDRGQIREAMTNLTKNAMEAVAEAGREGRIVITSAAAGDGIRIAVEDNGCGISDEDQGKLFQPYFTTKKQGSGIGLALTERIISLHGGRIFCESRKGEGTKFTLVFGNA